MTAVAVAASRLHPRDLVQVGSAGLRTRRLRSILSAMGIAIGIAAMVSVLGISESSRADLLSQLDKLGTNLLTASPGQTMFGQDASLPEEATAMARRIGPVEQAASTESLDADVYRSDRIPASETGGLSVRAASLDLLDTLETGLARGTWLNAATERYPATVLGAVAAERLGITRPGMQVWLGGQWFSVVGILQPTPLAPDIDRSALVGLPAAKERLGATGNPTTVYVRTAPDKVDDVAAVLPGTVNPSASDEVNVNRPSDAIEARAAAKSAFTALFLGLGAVALLVGGVGIANVMVISVLERRSEIGLRRALGATRRHVAAQFLAESLLLSLLGGASGVALGAVVTAAYAGSRGWTVVVPLLGLGGGVAAALLIGAVAGVYPAARAARLSPTEALRTV